MFALAGLAVRVCQSFARDILFTVSDSIGFAAEQAALVWACAAKRWWWLGEEMYGVWSMKFRVQNLEEDQRGPGERLSEGIVKHVKWTKRMPWIVVNGGRWYRISDDQVGCEWVSDTDVPWLSRTKAVKRLCMCVCLSDRWMSQR